MTVFKVVFPNTCSPSIYHWSINQIYTSTSWKRILCHSTINLQICYSLLTLTRKDTMYIFVTSSFFIFSPTNLNHLVHTTKISQEFLYLWPEDCEPLNISISLPSSHAKQRKWPFGTMGQNNGDQFKCSLCSRWSLSEILCVFDCRCIYMESKHGHHMPSPSHFQCEYMNELWSSLETQWGKNPDCLWENSCFFAGESV